MQSYEKLQKFFEDVQERKIALNDEKNVLIMQRPTLTEIWENAVFAGEGIQEAKQALLDLETQIFELNDNIRILEERVKTSSKVQELSQAVHDDCSHTLKGMRNNYMTQADKVQKLRDDYLRELGILGHINNIAIQYSFYASEASQYLPQRIHVGLNADRLEEVSLNEDLVKRTYKNGRNN